MSGSLEVPNLERAPITAPKPVTLEDADKAIPKNQRNRAAVVEFGEDMMKAMALLGAKVKLDNEIRELGNAGGNEKELADLEDNRRGIINALAELRPAEFATEAAFENYLNTTSPKEKNAAIQNTEKTKNDLEERYDQLLSQLRLAKIPGSSLENKKTELEAEFKSVNKERMETWKKLAELDPKKFKKDYLEQAQEDEERISEEKRNKLKEIINRM
ncbi:MAG: hypothetical protein WCK01_00260 [Candidatus Uhrbacteria bacterium]